MWVWAAGGWRDTRWTLHILAAHLHFAIFSKKKCLSAACAWIRFATQIASLSLLIHTRRQPHNLSHFSSSLVPTSLLRMHVPTASKTNWSLFLRRAQEMVCTTSLCLFGLTTEQGRSSNPSCCCWRACETFFFSWFSLHPVYRSKTRFRL